jgi:glyceraldehyde-3-phosphate dehydrogenase/erythrose-4-phosphate dehydrogenase
MDDSSTWMAPPARTSWLLTQTQTQQQQQQQQQAANATARSRVTVEHGPAWGVSTVLSPTVNRLQALPQAVPHSLVTKL